MNCGQSGHASCTVQVCNWGEAGKHLVAERFSRFAATVRGETLSMAGASHLLSSTLEIQGVVTVQRGWQPGQIKGGLDG
jgi:hypothetical protein